MSVEDPLHTYVMSRAVTIEILEGLLLATYEQGRSMRNIVPGAPRERKRKRRRRRRRPGDFMNLDREEERGGGMGRVYERGASERGAGVIDRRI